MTQRNFEQKQLQKLKKARGSNISAKPRVVERVTQLEDTVYTLKQQLQEIYEFWEAQVITTALHSEDDLSQDNRVERLGDSQWTAPTSGESVSEKVCD